MLPQSHMNRKSEPSVYSLYQNTKKQKWKKTDPVKQCSKLLLEAH